MSDHQPRGIGGIGASLWHYAQGTRDPVSDLMRFREHASASPASEAVIAHLPADDAAEQSAARWREGRQRPLEGILFGVKGIVDVKGGPVTCGSHMTGERVADHDAEAVARLRAAGAIPVAMTATTEYAAGLPFTPRHGTVTNPWDAGRWTGGSSTGSGAAVARRLLPLALGTDTGGSIRVPACWCGITGLKPTRGLVPLDGVAPLSRTLDHIGPMGVSAADLELAMTALSGLVPVPPRRLRIGVLDGWFNETVDASVIAARDAAAAVMADAGAEIVDVGTETLLGDMSANHEAGWRILCGELASGQVANAPGRDRQDAGLVARIQKGEALSAVDYIDAMSLRRDVIARLTGAWDVDIIMTPGLPGEAGRLDGLTIDVNGHQEGFDVISRNTMIWDLTGFPALMCPAGPGPSGLPLGVQFVARPGQDALCLFAGRLFQSVTDHHLAAPAAAALMEEA